MKLTTARNEHMNRSNLKTYAPQARRDFIQAVTDRATHFGLTAKKIEPMTEQGEVVLIGGRPFPKSVGAKRKKLEARIQKLGFGQTMEAMAYTWFNRLVAIRFMELHGYLEHGFRVLSHPEGHPQPEILEHAQHVDLPGLDQKKVVELKLDGTKEEELYRLLLIAQCNALHKALPFLFESIDDETELLLPDRLLHSDSLIRNLVNEIPEEDWREVEIIGWLYQFYISERKDEVIGKVVASEDIPAATQLFTPNWIVKYLVQNTLGRQWLATYPNSPLKGQMKYYIEPAEQTPEVQEQLKAITPTSLNPEELTLLDPACGSGHILVEAYDMFKAIYEEQGRRPKDIPALILTKNLFGLEIDDRAAQLAAFALMMKARADDRRIFDSEAKPNIVAIQDSRGLDAAAITHALNSPINKEDVPKESLFEEIDEKKRGLFSKTALAEKGHVSQADISALLELFESGKTFGSLIQIPPKLAAKLPEIENRLNDVLKIGDLTHASAHVLRPLLQQARLLARQYDAVVANPPYLHSKNMSAVLKEFSGRHFKDTNTDLFEMFIIRWLRSTPQPNRISVVCPFTWMFLSSFEQTRSFVLQHSYIESLIQLEYNAFEPACVPVCTFTLSTSKNSTRRGEFIRLSEFPTPEQQPIRTQEAIANPACGWRYTASTEDFRRIPGTVMAYWLTCDEFRLFERFSPLSEHAAPRQGLITGNNDRFLRLWFEVSLHNSAVCPLATTPDERNSKRWFPYQKGGPYRKWYGNHYFVVDWENDGYSIRNFVDDRGKTKSRPQNIAYFFRTGATWSSLTSGSFAFRHVPNGFIFDAKGPMCFPNDLRDLYATIAIGNVLVTNRLLTALAPTLDYSQGPVGNIPWIISSSTDLDEDVTQAIALAKEDWDESETSWDFCRLPLLNQGVVSPAVADSVQRWKSAAEVRKNTLLNIERSINDRVYGNCGVPTDGHASLSLDDITLLDVTEDDAIRKLLSYACGCMMGRYSLDKPGLIYAHSGNQGFDLSQYKTFPADDDGILPLTEFGWFDDDVAHRFEKFLATAWPAEQLDENLQFVADSLGPKKGESPRETIRRYFATGFYKDHMQQYKGPKHPSRPIYWLFSSGKLRGFQALVYLHRYNEGTLARMRTEYVIPLLGKMTARINHLTDDIAAATSSQHRKRLETEKATVTKQFAEVQAFDEKLRHCADQRIKLDLDDGVKVNYGKFSDLLAEVKTVTGGATDE